MGTFYQSQPNTSALNASTYTILGQERYLEKITEDLYQNRIFYGRELVKLSESEFRMLVGRTTEANILRVKKRLSDIGLSFR